jgi:hypothetical protein
MKLATIALASVFVLSSTFAFAHTTHARPASGIRAYQGSRGAYNAYATYGGPYNSDGQYPGPSYGGYRSGGLNGTADGPTDLVGGDTFGN